MSTTAKALIITWVIIGFLIVGGVGFYVGRVTAPKPEQPGFPQGQMNQPPSGQGGQFQTQPVGGQQQGGQPGGQPAGSYQQPR